MYGATGVTGTLVAKRVKELGLPVTLAGRNLSKLKPLGDQLGLPVAAVDLADTHRLNELVARHKVVLHVAGPFTVTSEPMIQACCNGGTHYLDVTGELTVMECAKSYDAAAKERGIMIMPAVGFDVIPGDCLALYLKDKLPSATELHLATFLQTTPPGYTGPQGRGVASHGTLLSAALHILPIGGRVWRNNAFMKEAPAKRSRLLSIRKDQPPRAVMSFPAAELFSTANCTGIPNITVYVPGSPSIVTSAVIFLVQCAARFWPFNRILEALIRLLPTPNTDPSQRPTNTGMACAAEAIDTQANKRHRASVIVGEGYCFTASSSVEVARRVLHGDFKPGYQTPAGAFGASLVQTIPGEAAEIVDFDS